MITPGQSELVTYTPAGTQPRWLGTIGHVEGLTYSYTNPGGPDQLSAILQAPAHLRTDALNPGRQLKVVRGGAVVWDGKLMEPAYDQNGWNLTGTGIGQAGTDFMAYYATNAWGTIAMANEVIDRAIARGLRWVRPNPIPGGAWFGQQVDPASSTVTDMLNVFCTKGTATWYVTAGTYGNVLSVYTFPTPTAANANRILVSPTPVARTMGGDYNYLWMRYQNNNSTTASPTYATTTVSNASDITAHGQLEDFDDLSSSGFQTLATIQAAGTSVLNRYQRASFAGPFQVRWSELLTTGGAPCDLGIDHCGTICKVIFSDFGFGGEVVPDPVVFMVGSYSWDESSLTATIAPFQSLDLSMSSLLQEISTVMPVHKTKPAKKSHHHKLPVLPHYSLAERQRAWEKGRARRELGTVFIHGRWYGRVPRPPKKK